MNIVFADVVEEIKQLSLGEKEELKDLLDNYLVDERREQILEHYHESQKEFADGKLKFSSDLNELKEMLND
ncbi:MAG: hypothetical protein WKF92_15900 [Pyrinomonadaceae bacterium]